MAQLLNSAIPCCLPCAEPLSTDIPGTPGTDGAAGAAGAAGISAYTTVSVPFVMPGFGSDVTVDVAVATWAVVGELVAIGKFGDAAYGVFKVAQVVSATQLLLTNVSTGVTSADAYSSNSIPTTIFPVTSSVGPTGMQGIPGTDGSSGAPADATYIVQTPSGGLSAEQAMSALGTGLVKNTTATGVQSIAADGTDYLSPATGLVTAAIGTTVQAFDAFLTSIAALGTAADKIIYTTALNVAAETAITSLARSLLANATAAAMQETLGKVGVRYGLLGMLTAVNLNSATTDNAVTLVSSRYRLDKVTIDAPTVNLTTATAGVFTAAGGGGTTLAADQSLAALTASTKFLDLVLQAIVGTDAQTAATLYLRVGTAQGVAATGNVYFWGWRMD